MVAFGDEGSHTLLTMNKYRVRIAHRESRTRYRDIHVEAYTTQEARDIVEGMYPDYEILSCI